MRDSITPLNIQDKNVLFNLVKPSIFEIDGFTVLNELRLCSNSEIDGFTKLRAEWKFAILKIDAFTKLKTKKVRKLVKIEKLILKTKANDSFSLTSMERAPQNQPKECINSKSPKIESHGFTKSGPKLKLEV